MGATKLSTILDHIDAGQWALPEFQRGYVWNRDQVRSLMQSLYMDYPIGGLLVWATRADDAPARGDAELAPGVVQLLLDGQQRITSLYGIIRGRPPEFFQGKETAFLGLHFHLESETLAFYSPVKMRGDPLWIDVTKLMQEGLGLYVWVFSAHPERREVYFERLNRLHQIKDRLFHVESVTGRDKTIEVVVEIFNKVNSGGTKLSQGDLALARVCAEWPPARNIMREALARWRSRDLKFSLDWLLRNLNTILRGEARFIALHDVDASEFHDGLVRAEQSIDILLNAISGRLGLDHDRVLFGRYAFPVMTHYLHRRGGRFTDAEERDKLLCWYLHAAMWGRFSGSTESRINEDLKELEDLDGGLDRLVDSLKLWRGGLHVQEGHFRGYGVGARFYPVLYMLSRVGTALDWGSGIPLRRDLLGRRNKLHVHHIFPKARLYAAGYRRGQVNAVANMSLQTADTNLRISDSDPATYLAEVEARYPGALASHWVPLDPELWTVDRYLDFLEARRQLLADATNTFLDELLRGDVPVEPARSEPTVDIAPVDDASGALPGGIETDDEEARLQACNEWVEGQGLPAGFIGHELADRETGRPLAVLDLAWPDGLQPGLSQPVAVLLDEAPETVAAASQAGFQCFTDVAAFKEHVRREVLGEPDAVLGVLGRYELIEELTGAGMATVYRARDGESEETVFVKRVPADGSHDGRALQREQNIYTTLLRNGLPGVLRVRDFLREAGFIALVTEWADGGSLADHVEGHPDTRLPQREVKQVALTLTRALAALHQADVVHRDLKPQNVVRVGAEWKLADFGIAKSRSRLITQHTFQQSGSLGYAPPEQLEGVEAAPSADVYAFGKLLAYMLTGQTDVDRVTFPAWGQIVHGCTIRDAESRMTLEEARRALERLPV